MTTRYGTTAPNGMKTHIELPEGDRADQWDPTTQSYKPAVWGYTLCGRYFLWLRGLTERRPDDQDLCRSCAKAEKAAQE